MANDMDGAVRIHFVVSITILIYRWNLILQYALTDERMILQIRLRLIEFRTRVWVTSYLMCRWKQQKPSKDKIREFFNPDFAPVGVVIVRPNQLGSNSSY